MPSSSVLLRAQTIILATLLLVGCVRKQTDSKRPPRLAKDIRIALLAEHEALMTQDPVTGDVPKDKLYEIRANLSTAAKRSVVTKIWEPLGPNNVGGRTRAILLDSRDSTGNTIWVGSVSGGLWRCTDALANPQWQYVEDWPGSPSISSIVQDPMDPEVLYVSTGEGWFNADAYRGDGIYKSTDGGISWSQLEATANTRFRYTQKLLFNARGELLACTRDRGIMRSSDGGDTWDDSLNNRTNIGSNRAADVEIAANGDLYAGLGIFSTDGVYRSTDHGDTWEYLEIPELEDSYERVEIALSPADSNRVLVLLQGEEDRECRYIVESADAGLTWRQLEVPPAIGMDNFARNQAWYDLVASYHPTDTNTVFIGGVDLLRSQDGGSSWQQLSSWRQGQSLTYVHADQHAMVYHPMSKDAMLFGNDGGLWYSNNLTDQEPSFVDLSQGYISTQFYACSVHPDPMVDYYMAGAQDNGTIAIVRDTMGPGIDVLGGDGAFNHIDGEDGDIRIAAFQRGYYSYTTDGWLTRQFLSPISGSLFINPTSYDTPSKTMYASYSEGGYLYLEVLTGKVDSIFIPGLGNNNVSALKVDPNNSEVLYLGSESGVLLRITNPKSQDYDLDVVRSGSGYLRNIDIDRGNSDRMVISYSNFNVQSVWYTTDGGSTFESLQSNLPNVPVRWVTFAPNDPSIIIAATEVGVWEFDTDPASDQEWIFVGDDIGPVRVDMVTPRYTDGHVAVASYGRGLYVTDDYATAALGFVASRTVVEEVNPATEQCIAETIVDISIELNRQLDTSVTVMVSAVGGNAEQGVDFDLLTDSITLSPQMLDTTIAVRIYSDRVDRGDRTALIELSTQVLPLSIERHTITVESDDQNPVTSGAVESSSFPVDGSLLEAPFLGFYEDGRSQFYYSEELLASIGFDGPTVVTALSMIVVLKESTIPYNGLQISLANSTEGFSSNNFSEASFTTVYQSPYTTMEGLNRFEFSQPFEYSGGGLFVQFCYDNSAFTSYDRIAAFVAGATGEFTTVYREEDGVVGCDMSDGVVRNELLPALVLERQGALPLASTTTALSSQVYPGTEAVYYEADSIVGQASIGAGEMEECLTVQVVADGAGLTRCQMCSMDHTLRQVRIERELEQEVTYRVFFAADALELLDSSRAMVYHLERDSLLPSVVETVNGLTAVSFSTSLEGTFALSQTIDTKTMQLADRPDEYDYIRYYNISGQQIARGTQLENHPSGVYIAQYMIDDIPVFVEKVFHPGD